MKKRFLVLSTLILLLTAFSFVTVTFADGHNGGATVLNSGEGKPDGFCFFGGFTADKMSAVVTPSGNGTLSCHFDGYPTEENVRFKDFGCFLNLGGSILTTNDTIFVATPSGKGQMTCQFN